eukprot:gnl/TRDRNA2_/TRDRNA2_165725_c0_seq2.p1 gnl/TRDRNA2_/TRDRNA2_165725_c0~~gnl/TRDRNA2_/TRDRNA2_165725_c0_seq2.p1  ORF type:complete len:211 (+),score=67.86 gnl/TRDRNA2_/TRDRNA2_165725_c0_seq2:339-971(+)
MFEKQMQVLHSEGLDANAAEQVLDVCKQLDCCVSYCSPQHASAAPQNAEHESMLRVFEGLEGVEQQRVKDCRDLLAAGELPLKVVALAKDPDACAERARALLPSGVVHTIAAEMHVEFLNPRVSKGGALAKLCRDTLGISGEEVAAFGDNHNDKEMLEFAGEGVAMKNAKEEVKAVANRVCIWSNDDDGIAQELEAMLDTGRLVGAAGAS